MVHHQHPDLYPSRKMCKVPAAFLKISQICDVILDIQQDENVKPTITNQPSWFCCVRERGTLRGEEQTCDGVWRYKQFFVLNPFHWLFVWFDGWSSLCLLKLTNLQLYNIQKNIMIIMCPHCSTDLPHLKSSWRLDSSFEAICPG